MRSNGIIKNSMFHDLEFRGTEYPTLEHLWGVLNNLQKRRAKEGITLAERQKTAVTMDECVLKWVQIGGVIISKEDRSLRFFFHTGMGCISLGNRTLVGCSLQEFVNCLPTRYED